MIITITIMEIIIVTVMENIIVTVIIIMIITKKGKLKAQLCQTLLRRMNRDFGNLTFLPEKKLRRNFKLFKKSFPESSDDMDFAYFQDFNFEILCFGQSCIFSPDSSYFLPVGVVPENIYDTGLKAISQILAQLICYSKCRCLSFGVYLDITARDHES